MTGELYYFVKIFQEVSNLFFLELEVMGNSFRVIDFILFNAIGHFLLDTLQTVYTRGRNDE